MADRSDIDGRPHPTGIRKANGELRRYILLDKPRSYQIWDRHTCTAMSGHLRHFGKAAIKCAILNGED